MFAIKEAIYKAIDPIVRRYVGFTEVELDVEDDGSVRVTVLDLARLPVDVEAWWREHDGSLARDRARPCSLAGSTRSRRKQCGGSHDPAPSLHAIDQLELGRWQDEDPAPGIAAHAASQVGALG